MGKKKDATPRKKVQSMDMRGIMAAALEGTDFTVSKEETRREDSNPYKNYDPDRKKKGADRTKNSSHHNQNASRGQGSNTGKQEIAHKKPVNQGPHAPYNFVPMQDQVMETKDIPGHNRIAGEELFTGYLHYGLTAQTPIMVDGGQGEFYRNKDGDFAIPGSTMRGLIRSNLQILGFSGFQDDIDDYSLMYRAVASGCLRKSYSDVLGEKPKLVNGHSITVLNNVKAGYIECRGKEYRIYRNVGDSNHTFKNGEADYYAVSERYVLEKAKDQFTYLTGKFQNKGPFKKDERNGRIHYIDRGSMPKYSPYYEEITYDVSNGRVNRIRKTGLKHKGYVISSGKMNEKKVFYVIPERDENDWFPIPEDSVRAFRVDFEGRKNTIKDNLDFYRLPEEGEIRPVFYIELAGRKYFGYTPRLRLMYDYSIHDGLHQKDVPCDYAKAIFGYSNRESTLKSRVFFTDAELANQQSPQKQVKLVLAEPKPTSYMEYLEQTDKKTIKTYNDDEFRLRGVKQYWLHKNVSAGNQLPDNKAVQSGFNPLPKDCFFEGSIRFQNLTQTELGLLIWSIRLEKDSQMNVGKAKAYGYGRVKVDELTLHLVNAKKAYAADSAVLSADPYERKTEEERDSFVDAYKDMLAEWLGVSSREDVMSQQSIKDFFDMKSYLADDKTASYMELSDFRVYQSNPLPTVGDIVKNSKGIHESVSSRI